MWSADEREDLDRDTLTEYFNTYKYLTLYASWERVSVPTTYFESTGEINGNITLETALDDSYHLDIRKMDISEALAKQNVKFLVDINMLNEYNEILEINGYDITIVVDLPDDVKGYDKYEAVYVKDGTIKERIPVTIEDGHMIFKTSHLSNYGLVAEKNEAINKDPSNTDKKEDIKNTKTSTAKTKNNSIPKTADTNAIALYIALMALSVIGMLRVIMIKKR